MIAIHSISNQPGKYTRTSSNVKGKMKNQTGAAATSSTHSSTNLRRPGPAQRIDHFFLVLETRKMRFTRPIVPHIIKHPSICIIPPEIFFGAQILWETPKPQAVGFQFPCLFLKFGLQLQLRDEKPLGPVGGVQKPNMSKTGKHKNHENIAYKEEIWNQQVMYRVYMCLSLAYVKFMYMCARCEVVEKIDHDFAHDSTWKSTTTVDHAPTFSCCLTEDSLLSCFLAKTSNVCTWSSSKHLSENTLCLARRNTFLQS